VSVTRQHELTDTVHDVWNGRLGMHVKHAGTGPPLIYLHPAGGPKWDGFLDDLAAAHTVFAPEHPGTSAGDPDAIDQVDELWDLVLIYEETIRALELGEPAVLVGQSIGGMLAAELAASFPALFSKLVLLAPAGLWRDDAPPRAWLNSPPDEMAGRLFADQSRPEVRAFLTPPEDPDEALEQQITAIWSVGCTGKFMWPIPDRGLRKRLHRITIPTLVIWGEQDDVMPSVYAEEFGNAIAGCVVEVIPASGHVVQVEQRDVVSRMVTDFVGASTPAGEQS
jgi:pimeloyl-ACP methyl ester carboxylesterase